VDALQEWLSTADSTVNGGGLSAEDLLDLIEKKLPKEKAAIQAYEDLPGFKKNFTLTKFSFKKGK
jgi:hypothetical protein